MEDDPQEVDSLLSRKYRRRVSEDPRAHQSQVVARIAQHYIIKFCKEYGEDFLRPSGAQRIAYRLIGKWVERRS